MTKNLVIYEKTLSMIEYGTIALQQFPKHEKFVLAAMVRKQMYQVLRNHAKAVAREVLP